MIKYLIVHLKLHLVKGVFEKKIKFFNYCQFENISKFKKESNIPLHSRPSQINVHF